MILFYKAIKYIIPNEILHSGKYFWRSQYQRQNFNGGGVWCKIHRDEIDGFFGTNKLVGETLENNK